MRQLFDYLPDKLKEIDEFAEIMRVAQPEIDLLFTERYKILDNLFLEKADNYGLSRLERVFKMEANSKYSQDERRFSLLVSMLEKRPTSINFIKQQLTKLCGENGYEIIENYGNYQIEVRLALVNNRQVGEVTNILKKVIPANMSLTVDLLYSRYSDFAEKTHTWMDDYSHNDIKEEYAQ